MKIKKWTDGSVIFEDDAVTMRETVENAVIKNVSLMKADLKHVDLMNANLKHADLVSADFSYADLRFADLRFADLRFADFSNTNFIEADFSDALYAVIGTDIRLRNFRRFVGLYDYKVDALQSMDGQCFILMGCRRLSIKFWGRNWWNNNLKYPNDGSAESEQRKDAYQYVLRYMQRNWKFNPMKRIIGE